LLEHLIATGDFDAAPLAGAAANLTAACLAVAGLLRIEGALRGSTLVADNLAALSAVGFLIASGLAYLSLRTKRPAFLIGAEAVFGLSAVSLTALLIWLVVELDLTPG
jgi:hypothetical protein